MRVVAGDAYKGLWNYAACEKLYEKYPETASFITIGPAGEMQLSGASVACTDEKGRPARHAARGGLGAVMGSKGLKFVSVDLGQALDPPAGRAQGVLRATRRTTPRRTRPARRCSRRAPRRWSFIANMLNTFPYKNRTEGQSPDVETLRGERIVESFATRGGGMHNCMTGCIVQCSNVVHDKDGNYKTSALEFETLTMLGANCGIASWEDVADLDRLCDEVGLDTIETGAAIAIYMDSGGMEFGDAAGAKRILHEIA